MADQYTVGAAQPVVVPGSGYGSQTVENLGPDSVYYAAGSTVSAALNDGTLAPGASLAIVTTTAFLAQSSTAALTASRLAANVPAASHGVKADGKTVTDGAITAGQATLASASAGFTAADQGKLCVVVGAGSPVSTALSAALTSGTGYASLPVNALPSAIPCGGVYVASPSLGATSVALNPAGGTISSLPVNALAAAIPAGTITIQSGYWQQTFNTTGAASNATSIPITAFGNTGTTVPNFAYSAGSSVFVQQAFITAGAPAGATALPIVGPFLGHLMGSNSNLSTSGPITSLKVGPLYTGVTSGGSVTLVSGGNSQTFTASATASAGATSIAVTSQTPNFAYPTGTIVIGPGQAQNAAYSFPSGSTVTTPAPALSTTIQSVSGGVATLAASAGTTVAGQAEVFFATDDTAAAQAALDATPPGGMCEFPTGDMGLSAALVRSGPITIIGQGATEIGAGGPVTTYSNVLYYPIVTAPYLRGSVFVQCAPNTDGIQLTGVAVEQSLEKFGVRFAGRFINTGHAINSTAPIQTQGYHDLGNQGFRWRDLSVFGHDGNHWAYLLNNGQYGTLTSLHSQGGGGISYRQDNGSLWAGQTGIVTPFCNMMVAGSCSALELGSYTTNTGLQNVNWFSPSGWIGGPTYNVPSNWCQVVQPNNGGCQDYMHTVSGYGSSTGPNYGPFQTCSIYSPYFLGGGYTGSGVAPKVFLPVGPGCTNIGNYPSSGPSTPVNPSAYPFIASGTSYQNQTGRDLFANFPVILEPPTTSIASTTLSAAASFNATSITVTSATGFAANQAILIDTGTLAEYTIITSVAGSVLNLSKPLFGNHSSGAAVVSGFAYAMVNCRYTSTLAGAVPQIHPAAEVAATFGDTPREHTLSLYVPNNWFYRLDVVNGTPQYAGFQAVG